MKSFVDMALTPREVNDKVSEMASPVTEAAMSMPKYPYGLTMCLGSDELKKVGMTDMPSAGEMIHGSFMAKVTSVSERDTESGKDCRVELQVTHLSLDQNDEAPLSDRRAKKMYANNEEVSE